MCSALYGRDLEDEDEEEEEEEEEEQLEVHRLPDLLFRNAPQLLQYTAALHARSDSNHDYDVVDDEDEGGENQLQAQRDHRGELKQNLHIGRVCGTSKIFDLKIKNDSNLSFAVSACLDGWFGDDCSVTCEDCVNGECSENAEQCQCFPGWMGTICNMSKSKCQSVDLLTEDSLGQSHTDFIFYKFKPVVFSVTSLRSGLCTNLQLSAVTAQIFSCDNTERQDDREM